MAFPRRNLLKAMLAGSFAPAASPLLASPTPDRTRSNHAGPDRSAPDAPSWGRGADGQRKADLGNGMFRNPIIAGDHPDPTILSRDGTVLRRST